MQADYALPAGIESRLTQGSGRHALAAITHSLEANKHFQPERERLERHADETVVSAEKELADTKVRIKWLNRQLLMATTTEEQHARQLRLRELEIQ
jgi:hypothetical protein